MTVFFQDAVKSGTLTFWVVGINHMLSLLQMYIHIRSCVTPCYTGCGFHLSCVKSYLSVRMIYLCFVSKWSSCLCVLFTWLNKMIPIGNLLWEHLMQCLGMLLGSCWGPETLWEVASAVWIAKACEESDNALEQSQSYLFWVTVHRAIALKDGNAGQVIFNQ